MKIAFQLAIIGRMRAVFKLSFGERKLRAVNHANMLFLGFLRVANLRPDAGVPSSPPTPASTMPRATLTNHNIYWRYFRLF